MWNAEGVERSVTPSAAWYYDPDLYRLELERIFARSWSFVGSTSDLARPGDYFTVDVAGEPVVVARGKDDRIRAFSNVCRHRAGPVAEGKGRRQSFVCGYHGWCYGLDGRLIAARDMDRRPGFDVDHIRLP